MLKCSNTKLSRGVQSVVQISSNLLQGIQCKTYLWYRAWKSGALNFDFCFVGKRKEFLFESMAANLQPSCCITAQRICRAYNPLFHRNFFLIRSYIMLKRWRGSAGLPVCHPLFPVFSVSRIMSRLCALMMTVLSSPSPLHKGTLLAVVLLFCFFT